MRIILITLSLSFLIADYTSGFSESGPVFNHGNHFIDSLMHLRTVSIAGVGDIMLGTTFPSRKYLPPGNNPDRLLESVIDSLRLPDITFGNLEGSFLNNGEPFKKCRDTSICYLFRMPEKYAQTLDSAGFDFISLANNHFGDFGWQGALRTRKLLDSLGICYAGPEENPYSIFEKDSVKYGFCAFSNTAGSNSMGDTAKAGSIVRYLDENCDIVIVSFHGGSEGADFQRVTRSDELFYGENRGNVYEFSHRMIDSGADVVFGHGPHVTRAIELYKERMICYSLGNFCTYGRFNISGPNGIAPLMKIKVDLTGRFISAKIIPVYQSQDGHVRIDSQGRVIKKIRDLTALDFPESGLIIHENGDVINK
jgi:poly-gamma-glutamate capsule biosynthesis protein CapA/YwtB (metallophosphatase superfamily)